MKFRPWMFRIAVGVDVLLLVSSIAFLIAGVYRVSIPLAQASAVLGIGAALMRRRWLHDR